MSVSLLCSFLPVSHSQHELVMEQSGDDNNYDDALQPATSINGPPTSHAGPSWHDTDPPSSDHEFALPPGNQLVLQAGHGGENIIEAPQAALQENTPLTVDGASATRHGPFRYSVNPPWGTQYLERAAKGLQTPGRPERNIWEESDT